MTQDVCHYCYGHLKTETISSLIIMRYKDINELDAKVENHDAANCNQFDYYQTKSNIIWAQEQNFISNKNDSGNNNSFNKLESFDENGTS